MPRTARLLVDQEVYHVITRGNNRQPIFHDDDDYTTYLRLLVRAKKERAVSLYHYVLMPNHVHLVVRATTGLGLRKMMQEVNQRYSHHYRRRYRYVGHLWQGRFKSLLIERESYLLQCGKYIELNPVRAGLVPCAADYRWASYHVYADGTTSDLVDPDPVYLAISDSPPVRAAYYRQLFT